MNISIIKHSDDDDTTINYLEKGAEFEVFLKSAGDFSNAKETERDYLITDENGFAKTKNMPYGTYTVHQTNKILRCLPKNKDWNEDLKQLKGAEYLPAVPHRRRNVYINEVDELKMYNCSPEKLSSRI